MVMSAQEHHLFEFVPFRLDPAERVLWRNGELVLLTPKAFETLLVLVEQCGHVVSKDDLMKDVWPDAFVEECGLARNISVLRKALGQNGEDHRYIETIPRRGYRFVAPVRKIPVRGSDLVVEKHTFARVITEKEEELSVFGKAGSALSALQTEALLAATKWVPSKRQALYFAILLLFVAGPHAPVPLLHARRP